MWQRSELKARAKKLLKRNYLALFLVAMVLWLSGGIENTSSDLLDIKTSFSTDDSATREHSLQNRHWLKSNLLKFQNTNALRHHNRYFSPTKDFFISAYGNHRMPLSRDSWTSFLLSFMSQANFIFVILLLCLRVSVGYIVECGCRRYFLQAYVCQEKWSDIFFFGSSQTYLPIVKAMFLRALFTLLWTLLLIIPGIVKSYSYKFVPYLMAEHPYLEAHTALRLSDAITQGHKWRIFIFDLSFIGWFLLGSLLFGKGGFLVNPYYVASETALYQKLKQQALDNGAITP